MYCPNCGSQVSESSRFCQNCGCPLPSNKQSQNKPPNKKNHSFLWWIFIGWYWMPIKLCFKILLFPLSLCKKRKSAPKTVTITSTASHSPLFNKKVFPSTGFNNSDNLDTINFAFNSLDSDLFLFIGSSLCPYCSIYSRRIYSVSGKDKRFPSMQMLPQNLRTSQCPVCGCFLGISSYYALNIYGELKEDIKRSNVPFIDSRTNEQKATYDRGVAYEKQKEQDRNDYNWLVSHLSDSAPKSFSGYRKMKNSNSANYIKLVNQAKENGYIIKQEDLL
ncbi:MAG: zinc-ribbon domain-containing protein [Clostridia bacterium]|nr:zinc-ribbon domain-containing protein [Clostridia bacterium]